MVDRLVGSLWLTEKLIEGFDSFLKRDSDHGRTNWSVMFGKNLSLFIDLSLSFTLLTVYCVVLSFQRRKSIRKNESGEEMTFYLRLLMAAELWRSKFDWPRCCIPARSRLEVRFVSCSVAFQL